MTRLSSTQDAPSRLSRTTGRRDAPHADRAASQRRKGRIPGGLFGMMALIVAIEGLVARRWEELSDPVSLSWQCSDRAARDQATGRDVLFLGDSLVKHGLIPSVLKQASGLDGMNLAAARAPALMSYFVLRRALDSGARPAAIVFDTKPAVLIGGADYNARYWPSALTPRECLELGWIAGRGQLGLGALAARMLPSLRSRLEIRSGVLAALEDRPDPIREINRVLLRNWTVNGGANVALLDSAYRGEMAADVRDKLHPDRWYVERSNIEGIDRLLRLARERGIRGYWLLPPIAPALQEWRERSGSEAKYEAFVRSFQRRYPRVVTVLDARRIARDPSLYVDATHLSGRGAIVLSRAVGRVLRDEATRPIRGWIGVADPTGSPRDGGDATPLEDVERSKQIVRGRLSG